MPQDKPNPNTQYYDYSNYMLDQYEEDLIKLVGPQHEGCYRVDILKRQIKELTAKYHEQITKDKRKNTTNYCQSDRCIKPSGHSGPHVTP